MLALDGGPSAAEPLLILLYAVWCFAAKPTLLCTAALSLLHLSCPVLSWYHPLSRKSGPFPSLPTLSAHVT
jgi:hypothetical protein